MFRLSDDERSELRDSARRFLAERSSSGRVREVLDGEVGHDRDLWAAMAELGWPAIAVPETDGGMGASFEDLAVVLHELGRQVTPSPMLASVLATRGLAAAPDGLRSTLLPAVAAGERIVGVALSNELGSYDASQLTVRATPDGDGVVLSGTSRFVPDAHVADAIVIAGRDGGGAVTLAVVDPADPGVTVLVEPTYDLTRRLARVTVDEVAVDADHLIGELGGALDLFDELVAVGAIATVCDAVGAAERILEIATAYAKERVQFNRPIGSFQAVKHHLANMFTDVEAARAAAVLAVTALDSGDDLEHVAAIATSFAGPACTRVASLAIQVHGGIGFTWEHDAHLFLKRVMLDEALFGSPAWHRRRLATMLLDGV